ncbi:hypothetical protein [Sulfurisoma sediminicola]|uniref:hypothetical protein n=1 Tax=Sulfurisoma sediminicola TaxID=1381557 RepID=UPI0014042E18|nr:hypothetical protein [Sulfurisoma sediminicola]
MDLQVRKCTILVRFLDIGRRMTGFAHHGIGGFTKPRGDPFPRAGLEEQNPLQRRNQ